jgi:hypothetical protein
VQFFLNNGGMAYIKTKVLYRAYFIQELIMKIIKTAQYVSKMPETVENPKEAIEKGYGAQCDYCKKVHYIDDFQSFDPNMCKGCAEQEEEEQSAFRNERPGGSHDMHGDLY